jgi:formylglycine-generating enzyme required for sulfatase activity
MNSKISTLAAVVPVAFSLFAATAWAAPECQVTLQPNATNTALVCTVAWNSKTSATAGVGLFDAVDPVTGAMIQNDAWSGVPSMFYGLLGGQAAQVLKTFSIGSGHGVGGVTSQPAGFGFAMDRYTSPVGTVFYLFSTVVGTPLPAAGFVVITIPVTGDPMTNFNMGTYTAQPQCSIAATATPYVNAGVPADLRLRRGGPDNGDVTLTWSVTPGARYRVEKSADLLSWTAAAGLDDISTPATAITVTEAGAALNRQRLFYRVGRLTGAGTTGLALIPAGVFQMGGTPSNPGEDPPPWELPVHSAQVSSFFLARNEVTWGLWKQVRDWARSSNLGYTDLPTGAGKADDHPVHSVPWDAVVKWCNARSEKENLTPCYTVGGVVFRAGTSTPVCDWSANGYRLPTEAEWEMAARGGLNAQNFPWGSTISHARANYYSSSVTYESPKNQAYHPTYNDGILPYTAPVGSFAPNAYWLNEMAGNVAEWCWDRKADDAAVDYPAEPQLDPRGPATGNYRIFRGGGWENFADECRSGSRGFFLPSYTINSLGFRTARSSVPQ